MVNVLIFQNVCHFQGICNTFEVFCSLPHLANMTQGSASPFMSFTYDKILADSVGSIDLNLGSSTSLSLGRVDVLQG